MKSLICRIAFCLLAILLAAGCRSSATPAPSTTGTTAPIITTPGASPTSSPTTTATASPAPSPTPSPTSTTPTTPAPTSTAIPPEQARTAALALPAVQRWIAGHSGAAVARQLNGAYQVNNGGIWQTAAKTSYDQALASPYRTDVTSQPKTSTVLLSSQYGFTPAQIAVIVDAASRAVVSVTPDLDGELRGGVLATFDVRGQPLRVFATSPAMIDSLFKLQSGLSAAKTPFGALKPGPGAGFSNAPWSWHLDPNDISLAEFTVELFDGLPQYVEDNLDYWLNTVKRFAPWEAKLVAIKDYR